MTRMTHQYAIATMEPDCGCLMGVCFSSEAGALSEWLSEQPEGARVVVITPPDGISVSRFCVDHTPAPATHT